MEVSSDCHRDVDAFRARWPSVLLFPRRPSPWNWLAPFFRVTPMSLGDTTSPYCISRHLRFHMGWLRPRPHARFIPSCQVQWHFRDIFTTISLPSQEKGFQSDVTTFEKLCSKPLPSTKIRKTFNFSWSLKCIKDKVLHKDLVFKLSPSTVFWSHIETRFSLKMLERGFSHWWRVKVKNYSKLCMKAMSSW